MKRLLFVAFVIFVSSLSQAANPTATCRLKPADIGPRSTAILMRYADVDGSLPDKMVIGSRVEVSSRGSSTPGIVAVHEAIYRPLENATYALAPLPLFGVEVDRARNAFYVCGQVDTRKNLRQVTIYLLRGYHLEPTSFGNVWGDLLNEPKLEVSPVTISEIPMGQLKDGILGIFKQIPLIGPLFEIPGLPFDVADQITKIIVGDFGGVGVERILITDSYVELANDVDLNNPSRAGFVRRINFKQAMAAKPAAAAKAISRPGRR